MSNNSINSTKKAFVRKLRRFWSIPIVRILAFLLIIIILLTVIINIFKGCGKIPDDDISEVSEFSVNETVSNELSEEVSEESAEPVVSLPSPWKYSSVENISSLISSEYGIIINATTREVIGGKNHTQRIYPASMTKIMTLIVAAQSGLDMTDEYTLSYTLINKYYLAGATTTGIYAGDTVTVKDLLYGAILLSAADATAAIAEIVAGSEEAYVELMNKKAIEIGCNNTHFTNTSGLFDTSNYSTLGDIALMLDYAMSIPLCKDILSEDVYYTSATPKNDDGYVFHSTMYNRINHDSIDGMTLAGGKTGYIYETRHCLASMAVGDNGERFIVVTVGAKLGMDAIDDCKTLYLKYYGGNQDAN